MEIFQWARNPWGEDILVRISWDLLYAALVAGFAFLLIHALYVALYVRFWVRQRAPEAPPGANVDRGLEVPPRIPRHSVAARLFHWVMAAAMFVLLFTGFLPVVGVQFEWVAIHWIAGLVLIGSVLFHIVYSTFWMDVWAVWISGVEIKESVWRMKRALGQSAPPPRKPAKYPVENKLYHHITILTGGATMVTGLLMMKRVETPFWVRDPYMLSDNVWGLIYVAHGLASVSLVALVMVHVYFAIRPEKLWITRSMIWGWIDREHYLQHHDPTRWGMAIGSEPGAKVTPEHERVTV